jgi:hypothetical protein
MLYSLSDLGKRTNSFGFVVPNILGLQILRDPILDACQISVFHFLYVMWLNFSFDAQNFPSIRDCSHVITLLVFW